jgi:hypothetical protein
MKTNEVIETMKAPSLAILTQKFVNTNIDKWNSSPHIGDIENYQVKKHDNQYSIWDTNTLIATSSLNNHIVDQVWVNPEYRGQKIFSKLLWFYKTRENMSPLILGPIHSAEMQEVVKGLSRFKKYWSNGHETRPFSIDTLDNFYSYEAPTEWSLYLENSGNFSDWPRFTTGNAFIKEDYNWIIQ